MEKGFVAVDKSCFDECMNQLAEKYNVKDMGVKPKTQDPQMKRDSFRAIIDEDQLKSIDLMTWNLDPLFYISIAKTTNTNKTIRKYIKFCISKTNNHEAFHFSKNFYDKNMFNDIKIHASLLFSAIK